MGYGEEYLGAFNRWFSRKHASAMQRYALEYPEPEAWAGFYLRRGLMLK